jgi:hypothetical protein
VKALIILAILFGLLLVGGSIYLRHPKFGPEIDVSGFTDGQASPRYIEERFQNIETTEVLVGDNSTMSIILQGLFHKRLENLRPISRFRAKKPT